MRASLVSREVIADSIELVGRSQPFDGLVCLVGCDKTAPGAVMAMLRLDVPGLVLYSGAMAPGVHRGAPVTILDVWEAVGAHEGGAISDEELDAHRAPRLPGVRRLHGALHGEHDGGRRRLPRARPDRARQHHRDGSREGGGGRGGRPARARRDRARRPPAQPRDARGARERDRRRHRHRRLDERRPAPARDRRRGRRRTGARGLRPALGVDAGRHEPDAGRALRRRRPPPRRRLGGGDEAAARPSARRRGDGRRAHARRARGRRTRPGRRGARAGRSAVQAGRRARVSSAATSRQTARS